MIEISPSDRRFEVPARGPVVEVVDNAMAAILREKTPLERQAIANGMWCGARDLIRDAVRQDHPDWDEERVAREVAWRLSGKLPELAPPGEESKREPGPDAG
jgi:hypothetical protein